ncbi:MAG: hypothetical protein Q8L41_00345 [Anaerolineales bacterium]|nr:hypothetical protein [Anaerolineales bacterium]
MNTRPALLAALILLTTALACVLPGIQSVSRFAPTPTADTRLDIMVARTVSAALDLTALAVPTVTPTLPTATQTVTPTPQPFSSGSSLTKQDNGSSLFVDENAGYEITVPAGWLAVRLNENEYYDAWTLPETADSHIQTSLLSIKEQDPATFRLLVLDIQEGHIKNEIVTNLNFIWDQQTVISFDTEDDLQAFADGLPSTMDGLTVSSVEIVIPPGGLPYGVIKSEVGGFNVSSAQVSLYKKMVFFNLKTGTLVITFSTENGFTETTLPAFDGMLGTIAVQSD